MLALRFLMKKKSKQEPSPSQASEETARTTKQQAQHGPWFSSVMSFFGQNTSPKRVLAKKHKLLTKQASNRITPKPSQAAQKSDPTHSSTPSPQTTHAKFFSKFIQPSGQAKHTPAKTAPATAPSAQSTLSDQQKNFNNNLHYFVTLLDNNFDFGTYNNLYSSWSIVGQQKLLKSEALNLLGKFNIEPKEISQFIKHYDQIAKDMPKRWSDKLRTPIENLQLQLKISAPRQARSAEKALQSPPTRMKF